MKRSGIVIGGEHAGQRHSVAGEYLKLPIPVDISPIAPIGPVEIPTEFIRNTTVVYQFVEMKWRHTDTRYQDRNFGFWVPVEEKYPQPFILDTLIESYRNANR